MRMRRRYLVIHLMAEDTPPKEFEVRSAIWHQLQALYGELGVSRIGFWVVIYDASLSACIIRCQHDQVRTMRAALASITTIGSSRLIFHVLGVSGTIRKAKTFIPGLERHKSLRRIRH